MSEQTSEDLVRRFLVAFNQVDEALRRQIGAGRNESFSSVLKSFNAAQRRRSDVVELKRLAELRNHLVHSDVEYDGVLATPTPKAIAAIERIAKSLTRDESMYERFGRDVEFAEAQHSLRDLLIRIADAEYSQFPVFESEKFVGLLTENGITRWLARQMGSGDDLIEFSAISIREVLDCEEVNSGACRFVPRDRPSWEAESLFRKHVQLEAVLVTHNGRENEKLLGIATRFDLVGP